MFKRVAKLFGGLIAAIILIVVATLAASGFVYLEKARERTATGMLRYTSHYLPMSDGTRIAIDISLPKVLKPGDKIPALIKGTLRIGERVVSRFLAERWPNLAC